MNNVNTNDTLNTFTKCEHVHISKRGVWMCIGRSIINMSTSKIDTNQFVKPVLDVDEISNVNNK